MPIHLPPISRRRFLGGVTAGVAATLLGRHGLLAADASDVTRIALLSDTHVNAERATIANNVNLFENLKRVCADVLAREHRPAAAFVTGDLAHIDGRPGDYARFLELLKPMREAGVPLHLGLGNHDHRENFWQAIDAKPDAPPRPVETHHVARVETPHADLYLLDSLDKCNVTPGLLGEAQLRWLTKSLDAATERPAIVLVHHNPDTNAGALADTPALLDAIVPRRQVKALVFGHTHNWRLGEREGLHLVNLPPVAYVFGEGRPNGWIEAAVTERSMTLMLRCLDDKHPLHNEVKELAWR